MITKKFIENDLISVMKMIGFTFKKDNSIKIPINEIEKGAFNGFGEIKHIKCTGFNTLLPNEDNTKWVCQNCGCYLNTNEAEILIKEANQEWKKMFSNIKIEMK